MLGRDAQVINEARNLQDVDKEKRKNRELSVNSHFRESDAAALEGGAQGLGEGEGGRTHVIALGGGRVLEVRMASSVHPAPCTLHPAP